MTRFGISNLAQAFEDLEKIDFDIKMKNKAIGYLVDQEDFINNKENRDIDIEFIKELVEKESKKYEELSGNDLDPIDVIRLMVQADKIKQSREFSDLKEASINAYHNGDLDADNLVRVVSVIQEYNKDVFSYRDYAQILLATKNEQDYNEIIEYGLKNDPKTDFKNGVFEEILKMNNYINNSKLVDSYALQSLLGDMSSYYASTPERGSEFLNVISTKDKFNEPVIKNDLAISVLLSDEFDFSLVEKNDQNIDKIKKITSDIFVNNLNHIYEFKDEINYLNEYSIDKLEQKGLFKLIDKKDWDSIRLSMLETVNKDFGKSDEQINNFVKEIKFIDSNIVEKIQEINNTLGFEEKFKNIEKRIIEDAKNFEIVNSVLDYIDYGFSGQESFENNLVIASVEDVMKEIKKSFPNLDEKLPSEEDIEAVKKQKINENNLISQRRSNNIGELAEKLQDEINSNLEKGVSLSNQGVSEYLNYLDDQKIDNFELRMIPLVKAKDEQEFKSIFDKINGEHKINFEYMVMKTLLMHNEIYENREKEGFVDQNISHYISEFNKSQYQTLSSYLLTTPQVSSLAVDHYNEFKSIYPKDISDDVMKKMSNAITNKILLNAVSEHQAGNSELAVKNVKLLKVLNDHYDNQPLIKKMKENLSKMDDLENAEFFKEYKGLIKPEDKKRLKM